MAKFTCPYCYDMHDVMGCKVRCSYNNPNKPGQVCYFENVAKDKLGWIPRKDIGKCMKCHHAKTSLCCVETDKEIPQDYLFGKSFSVALLGAKASGKSNYIGVLVNEIKTKMSSSFNCILNTAASSESKRYYDDYYYRPLFKEGYVVQATSNEIIPPLIFPLRFLDKKNRIKNVAALSFYDTAGENLDSHENIHIKNRYIPNANGIILLLDPLQIPAVREKLEGKVALPEQNTDTTDLIAQVKQAIRDVKKSTKNINIPLALVFTKLDVLQEFDILDQDSILREESEHVRRGVFVEEDYKIVKSEINTLLENFAGELEQELKEFTTYSLFGVSALGSNPNGPALGGKIHPCRVLDPLLWLLAENGYIPKTKR